LKTDNIEKQCDISAIKKSRNTTWKQNKSASRRFLNFSTKGCLLFNL